MVYFVWSLSCASCVASKQCQSDNFRYSVDVLCVWHSNVVADLLSCQSNMWPSLKRISLSTYIRSYCTTQTRMTIAYTEHPSNVPGFPLRQMQWRHGPQRFSPMRGSNKSQIYRQCRTHIKWHGLNVKCGVLLRSMSPWISKSRSSGGLHTNGLGAITIMNASIDWQLICTTIVVEPTQSVRSENWKL